MNLDSCNIRDLKELWGILNEIILCDNIWQGAAKKACQKHVGGVMNFVCKWGYRSRPHSDNSPMKVDVTLNLNEIEIKRIGEELTRQYHLLESIRDEVIRALDILLRFVVVMTRISVASSSSLKEHNERLLYRVWWLLLRKSDEIGQEYAIPGFTDAQHEAFDKLVVGKLFASTTIKDGRMLCAKNKNKK